MEDFFEAKPRSQIEYYKELNIPLIEPTTPKHDPTASCATLSADSPLLEVGGF